MAKVVFLDRDGVINKYPGDTQYVSSIEEFEFIGGSIEGVRKFNEKGFKVFIVSNQAGVSKGVYSHQDLDKITRKMQAAFKKKKVFVDAVYYCLHREEDNCSCRKPKTGLLDKSLADFKIKPSESFFIGDSFIDMETAVNFGAKSVLVLSGKEKISNRSNWKFEPEYIFDNLLIAAHYICTRYG